MPEKPKIISVPDAPRGNVPFSIRIEEADLIRGHPSFRDVWRYSTLAIIRNQDGFVIGGVEVDKDLLEAERKGGVDRRIARLDVCDLMKISQDIVDN